MTVDMTRLPDNVCDQNGGLPSNSEDTKVSRHFKRQSDSYAPPERASEQATITVRGAVAQGLRVRKLIG